MTRQLRMLGGVIGMCLAASCGVVGGGSSGPTGGGTTIVNAPGPNQVTLKTGDKHNLTLNSVEFTITMTSLANGTIQAQNEDAVDTMLIQVTDADTGEFILPVAGSGFTSVSLTPGQNVESNAITLGNGRRLSFIVEDVGTSSSPPACSRGTGTTTTTSGTTTTSNSTGSTAATSGCTSSTILTVN